jgi:hypothetical protein
MSWKTTPDTFLEPKSRAPNYVPYTLGDLAEKWAEHGIKAIPLRWKKVMNWYHEVHALVGVKVTSGQTLEGVYESFAHIDETKCTARFYPDIRTSAEQRAPGFAIIPYCERNLMCLALSFYDGPWTIEDEEIRMEVEKRAIELGVPKERKSKQISEPRKDPMEKLTEALLDRLDGKGETVPPIEEDIPRAVVTKTEVKGKGKSVAERLLEKAV